MPCFPHLLTKVPNLLCFSKLWSRNPDCPKVSVPVACGGTVHLWVCARSYSHTDGSHGERPGAQRPIGNNSLEKISKPQTEVRLFCTITTWVICLQFCHHFKFTNYAENHTNHILQLFASQFFGLSPGWRGKLGHSMTRKENKQT